MSLNNRYIEQGDLAVARYEDCGAAAATAAAAGALLLYS